MSKKGYARPKRRNIDKVAVTEFFHSIGFNAKRITQEWRHLTAFGTYEGKDAVFKLASTIKTSTYTQNEFYWNEAVHLVAEKQRPNLTVPLNFSSGKYGKLFYFIAQRFMNEPFAMPKSAISEEVASRIQQIAAITREIELLSIPGTSVFAKGHNARKELSMGQRLLNSASEWASQVPKDLDAFLEIIDDAKEQIRTCPVHGDFVIRQMYDVDGKIGVIDGEHAGLKGAYHYDVAQFYLRLRNDHDALELAHQYLNHFYNLLPKDEQETFWSGLKPVLIQRYIGELWGAAKDSNKLATLETLGTEILEDKVFTTS